MKNKALEIEFCQRVRPNKLTSSKSTAVSKQAVSVSCLACCAAECSADSDRSPYGRCCISRCSLARPAYVNLKEMKQIRFIPLSLPRISPCVIHFLRSDVERCSQRGEINTQPLSTQRAPNEIWHAGGDRRGFWEDAQGGLL